MRPMKEEEAGRKGGADLELGRGSWRDGPAHEAQVSESPVVLLLSSKPRMAMAAARRYRDSGEGCEGRGRAGGAGNG